MMNVTFSEEVIVFFIPTREEQGIESREIGIAEALNNSLSVINKAAKNVFDTIGENYLDQLDREMIIDNFITPSVNSIINSKVEYMVTDIAELPRIQRKGGSQVLYAFLRMLLHDFFLYKKVVMFGCEPKTKEYLQSSKLHLIVLPSTVSTSENVEQCVRLMGDKLRLALKT